MTDTQAGEIIAELRHLREAIAEVKEQLAQGAHVHSDFSQRLTRLEEQNRLLKWLVGAALGGLGSTIIGWIAAGGLTTLGG